MDPVLPRRRLPAGRQRPITTSALLAWGMLAGSVAFGQADPWPFAGRTATRVGHTATIGPQTPTIAWRVRFSTFVDPANFHGSPVMDAAGRVFVVHYGLTAVDSRTRQVIWTFPGFWAWFGPALADGRVMWGDDGQSVSTFYCVDAATGEEAWRYESDGAFGHAAVADAHGVVYFPDAGSGTSQSKKLLARRIADGSEVWTTTLGGDPMAPSLDYPFLVTNSQNYNCSAFNPLTGERRWTAPTQWWLGGLAPIYSGQVYVGDNDSYLYCFDAVSGARRWRFFLGQLCQGAVAVGHDGTIYCGTTGNEGRLFAVTPDGQELWRYLPDGLITAPPIVAGDGVIYFTCTFWTGQVYVGWVYALRPDGTLLWRKQMPDKMFASPMLAPDGTLYVVCDDKYLYAFHDHMKGDLNCDFRVNFDDINPFVLLLSDPAGWQAAYPDCPMSNGDCNGDGQVNFDDINPFVALLAAG